jgi:hypothetical protein
VSLEESPDLALLLLFSEAESERDETPRRGPPTLEAVRDARTIPQCSSAQSPVCRLQSASSAWHD